MRDRREEVIAILHKEIFDYRYNADKNIFKVASLQHTLQEAGYIGSASPGISFTREGFLVKNLI